MPACQIHKKYEWLKCNREALAEDTEGLCLLHSKKEDKDPEGFTRTIKAKLDQEDYDFHGVVFPAILGLLFFKHEFIKDADFSFAVFQGEAVFSEAAFKGEAIFPGLDSRAQPVFPGPPSREKPAFSEPYSKNMPTFGGPPFRVRPIYTRAPFKERPTFPLPVSMKRPTFPGLPSKVRQPFFGPPSMERSSLSTLIPHKKGNRRRYSLGSFTALVWGRRQSSVSRTSPWPGLSFQARTCGA